MADVGARGTKIAGSDEFAGQATDNAAKLFLDANYFSTLSAGDSATNGVTSAAPLVLAPELESQSQQKPGTVFAPQPPQINAGQVASIAFTAFQSDNSGGAGGDYFQFVLLAPVTTGTTIYFTDNGYRTDVSAFRTNENMLRWVAQSNLAAGTVVSFVAPAGAGPASTAEWTGITPTSGATLGTAAFGLATAGDNITALVNPTFGGTDALTGTAIAAITWGGATFSPTFTASSGNGTTALPPGLTDGVNAVSIAATDNGLYTGTTFTGTQDQLLAALNSDANWSTSTTPFTTFAPATAFTVQPSGAFSINDPVAVAEGNSGTTAITFTVTRSGTNLFGAASVDWALDFTGVSDPANSADFSGSTSGTVNFATDQTTATITVNVAGDMTIEPHENFRVVLSNNTAGTTISDNSGTGTITNDDIPPNVAPTVTIVPSGGAFAPLGGEILVNTATAGPQDSQQITALSNGGFVVTWTDGSLGVGGATGDTSGTATKAQVFAAGGTPVGSEIRVNTATADNQNFSQITALSNGGFVVTWRDGSLGVGGATGDASGNAIKAQVFAAGGTPVGSEIRVNTATVNSQDIPQITALSNGGFVVTWRDSSAGVGGAGGDTSGAAVKAQVFAAGGTPVGSEILVNTATVNSQSSPQITALSNGGFVVTWTDGSLGVGGTGGDTSGAAVKAQVFAANGTPVGSEILVNTATESGQDQQQITALSTGGFVVTWQDSSLGFGGAGGDTSGTAIKAQVFTAGGTPVGSEILVNTATFNSQNLPQITALSNGGFVVTWRDTSADVGGAGGDTSSTAVKAQVFTASGAPVGSEILVNTATANVQDQPQITALSNGGFVVTWRDDSRGVGGATGDTSSTAVKAQVFGPAPYAATEQVALSLKGGTTIADVDAGNGVLTATLSVGYGVLNVSAGTSGATIVSGNGTGSVVVSGTLAQLNALLASDATSTLSFTPNTDTPPASTTFSVSVDDGGNTGSGGAQTGSASVPITITALNDAPSGNDTTLTISEDTSRTLTSADFGFSDVDGNSLQAVTITSLPSAGALTLNGVAVTAGQSIPVASLPQLVFTPALNGTGTGHSSFTFQVQDDGGAAGGGVDLDQSANTITFDVTPVSDAPAGADATLTIPEDTPRTLTAADFGFSDVEGDSFTAVTITTLPGAGTLTLNGVAVTAGQSIPVASLPQLLFTPAANANGNGYASFTFQVQDNGSTAGGGVNLDASPNTLTVNVSAANDAPTVVIAPPPSRIGSEFLVNNVFAGDQREPTITALASGRFVVAWTDFGGADGFSAGIRARIIDATGTPVGNEIGVNSATDYSQSQPRITALASGGFVVTWTDETGDSEFVEDIGETVVTPGIKAQIFDANGNPVGNEFRVNTLLGGIQDAPAIAAIGGGQFVVTWADSSGSIVAQRFEATGAPVGGEIFVPSVISGLRGQPSIASLASGGFAVSWIDLSGEGGDSSLFAIKLRRFDALGQALGNEVLVNTSTFGNQFTPQVTGLASGGFVVVWHDESGQGGDASGTSVKGQVFDASGARVGSEFLVNDVTSGNQLAPTITELTNGQFVVSWRSGDADQNISARVFSASGFPVGTEFVVNGTTSGEQSQPSVTALPGGGFAISWTDFSGVGGDNNGAGIKTQIFGNGYFVDEQVALSLKGGIAVGDIDAGSGTITVTLGVGYGRLDVTAGTSGATVAGSGTGTVTLTGTLAQIQALLTTDATSSVTFTANTDAPPASATLTVTIDDGGNTGSGGALQASASTTIVINAINDAPAGTDGSASLLAGATRAFTAADFGFSDVDGNSLAAVRITTLPTAGTLSFDADGAGGNAPVAVTAGQSISAADIAAGRLTYTAGTSAGTPSFTFQVQDNGGTANGGVDLDQSANNFSFTVTQPGSISVANVSVSEGDTGTTAGALTLTRTDGSSGAVSVDYVITLPGGAGRATGADVSGALTGTVTFADGETSATIPFSVVGDYLVEGDETFTVALSNPTGGAAIGTGTATATITDDDVAGTLSIAGVTIVEGDSGQSLARVVFTRTGGLGAFSFDLATANGTATEGVDYIGLAGSVPVPGGVTVFGIDFAIYGDRLFEGDETFFVNLSNPTSGLILSNTQATVTITNDDVHQAPAGTNATLTILEDTPRTLTAADFGFSDIDGDSFAAVTITTLPAAGSLTLNGVAVTAGQSISVASLPQLVFTPAANANGNGYASFTFQVQDNGGTANGGVDLDASPNTLTFDVTPVNDAPTVTIVPGGAAFAPLGSEILVNTATASFQATPQITTLSNGGFVVIWIDDSRGVGGATGDTSFLAIKAQVFAAGGAPVGNEILVNTVTDNNQDTPQITALSNGGFVVTWRDGSGASGDTSGTALKAQVFAAGGTLVGSEILVNSATVNNQSSQQITALSNGGFVVTWTDESQGVGGAGGDTSGPAVKAQVFTAGGTPVGSEILVNTAIASFQATPQITALTNGGFVVTWTDLSAGIGGAGGDTSSSAIKAQVFAAGGTPVGSEILVNTATTFAQDTPQITALSNGGFVVTWRDGSGASGDTSGGDIRVQVFAAGGTPVGGEILVNTTITGFQFEPLITALSNGGFVVTWQDDSAGFDDTVVRAQVFAASGVPVGSEILVNTATAGVQVAPQITALTNGGFVVTWTDFSEGVGGAGGDTSGAAIKAQVFAASGAPLGSEILVNTATFRNQSEPQIAALPNGGFVVTWTDNSAGVGGATGDANSSAIKAQVFGPFTYEATEQAALNLKGGVTIADVDAGTGVLTATLGVGYGVLDVTVGTSGATIVSGNGTGSVVVSGTLAQLNALLASDATSTLSFTANTDAPPASTTFSVSVDDGGNTGTGGPQIGSASVPITITALNDAPTGNDATLTILEDTPRTLTAADFGFSDVEGNSFAAVVITTLPSAGSLTLNGVAVTAGQSIPVASLPQLAFTPAANASGNGYASFTFQVQDNGGTANGGVDLDASPNTLTFNVTPVNDPAVAVNDPTNTVDENATVAISVLANDSDAENDPLSVATINGAAATVGVAITLASGATATLNADGTISYNPNGRFAGLIGAATAAGTGATNTSTTDSFTYGLTGGGTATVTVTINGVDSPDDQLGGGNGDDTVNGRPTDDFIDLSQGGNDTALGGDGNDAFFFGATFDANDNVQGGGGNNDQIGLQGNYGALTLGTNSTNDVEVIAVLPGAGFGYNITTIDANVAAGKELVIFGTNLGAGNNLTFNGSAETNGTFRIYGGLGVDNLTGGAGNDGFYFGPNRFGASDFINGGAGTNDQVALDGNYTATINSTQLQNVEVLALLRGVTGDLANYNITLADDLVGAGQTFTVFGLAVETGFTLDATAETDGNLIITGGSGNETITTGAGNDRIFGGGGADVLNGGVGADTFVYDAASQSTGATYDRVTGFVSGTDRFDFNFAVTGVDATVGAGALSTASFDANLTSVIGAGQLAANHAVLFQADGGDLAGQTFLVVDANGVAGYQAGQDYVIQLVTPPASLTVADFV